MIDLHTHSMLSDDGELSPAGLVTMACEMGLQAISLTDHNVVRGTDEVASLAAGSGLEAIPGIEIDCTFRDLDLHLLGYYIDPHCPGWVELERNVLDQEIAAVDQKAANLRALGLPVDVAEARRRAGKPIVSAQVMADMLLSDSALAQHPRLRPYRLGGSRGDMPLVNFYWDYFAQGRPAYVPFHFPTFEQALGQVRRSGGVPVLAHPGHSLRGRLPLLSALRDLGLMGVEAFSTYHKPQDTSKVLAAASHLDLLLTCGSDFHGLTKPAIQLGGHGCTLDEKALLGRLRQAAGRG